MRIFNRTIESKEPPPCTRANKVACIEGEKAPYEPAAAYTNRHALVGRIVTGGRIFWGVCMCGCNKMARLANCTFGVE